MPTMNETSTITLPECHNILALLLLSLNTPSVSSSSTTQEEEMIKKEKKRQCSHRTRCKTAEQSRSSSTRSRQRDKPHTQDTPSKKERRVSHQKRKTDKTSPPPASAQTQTIHPREESHPKETKQKKEKPHDTFPPHQPQHPATPADTDPHPIILFSTHLRAPVLIISATAHTLNYTLLTTPCPHTACRHCAHHPCLHSCPQLYPFLSRSCYRSPSSTCAPLPDGRYGPPPPGYHMLTCILLLSQCYLHTVHMSVCTTVLTLLQHPDYRLGFSHCAHHSQSSSPSTCHPGRLRYHQSLTRVHSHSLPVPPPLPLADARSQGGSTVGRSRSLACGPVVRLSLVVPLAGESPLADARLPPHPNGHLLLAKRSPTHHAPLLCQHLPCTHTCQHSCSHACYQFCPHHAYSTSSNPASITLRA